MRLLASLVFFASAPAIRADDFKPLFDGKTFTGWKAQVRPAKDGTVADWQGTWSIIDGVLKCTGKPNGYLATTQDYENYKLRVKWRFPKDSKGGNSGVLLHVQADRHPWPNSIEAQLASGRAGELWLIANAEGQLPRLDIDPARKDPDNKEGRRFFRVGKDEAIEKPFGEWNQYEIICNGGNIELTVNGKRVNSGANGALKKGRIALQSEGVEIHFKDIELAPLK